MYNLGKSKTTTLRELIDLIGRHVRKTLHIETSPLQPGDVTRTFADVTRARAELNYAPRIDIDEGIRRMVAWYRAEQAG